MIPGWLQAVVAIVNGACVGWLAGHIAGHLLVPWYIAMREARTPPATVPPVGLS